MVAGVCQPRVAGTVGAEPFSAKLRYTGTEDTDHPNLIKLTVTMPHIDGKDMQMEYSSLKILVPHVTHQPQFLNKKLLQLVILNC